MALVSPPVYSLLSLYSVCAVVSCNIVLYEVGTREYSIPIKGLIVLYKGTSVIPSLGTNEWYIDPGFSAFLNYTQ